MNITATTSATAAIAAWLLTFLPLSACASDDHAHVVPTPSAGVGSAAPTRFALVSDTLELVGVLNGRQLTLYLDRAADNRPVPGARIELDIGGQRITATSHGAAGDIGHDAGRSAQATSEVATGAAAAVAAGGADVYEAALPPTLKPGHLPVNATVTVDGARSVLAGELDLPDTAATASNRGSAEHGTAWSRAATWSAASLALLLVATLASTLRARRTRRRRLAFGDTAQTGAAT